MKHKTIRKKPLLFKVLRNTCFMLLPVFAFMTSFLLPSVAIAALLPSGTIIDNIATVDILVDGTLSTRTIYSNTVSATVIHEHPNIQILLTSSHTEASYGDEVTVTATVTNAGPGAPHPVDITVDGILATGIPLAGAIPDEATFVRIVPGFPGIPLYHILGDPATVFSSTPPADLTLVDRVGIGIATLPAGDTVSFSVDMTAQHSAMVPIQSTATIESIDPSDSTQNTIVSNEIVITLTETLENLLVEKKADKATVGPGESIGFEIIVRNQNASAARNVIVEDLLPRGLTYLPGSTRLVSPPGTALEPTGGVGPRLEFPLDDIPPNSELTFKYRVIVGAGARSSDLINRATAYTENGLGSSSNTATSKVRIREGILSDRAILFGKVFVDKNTNRIQDRGEPGIPGVRLILEDGTSVITDLSGKYHIYGILPMTHVVKVDRTTLPKNARLAAITNRHRGAEDYAFVDIKAGELHKLNFAEVNATENILSQVKARKEFPETYQSEIMARVDKQLRNGPQVKIVSDPKSLPAEGIIGGKIPGSSDTKVRADTIFLTGNDTTTANSAAVSAIATMAANIVTTMTADSETQQVAPDQLLPSKDIESLIKKASNTLGFENLTDNQILSKQKIAIRIKGNSGANLLLSVNDEAIGKDRIGARTVMASSQTQMLEYIGVKLKEGKNSISLSQTDSFGNERGSKTISVMAPGNLSQFVVTGIDKAISASSDYLVPVVIELKDKNGLPVLYRTQISLTIDKGTLNIDDVAPKTPGIQVFAEKGRFIVPLRPPNDPGKAVLKVWQGEVEQSVNISYSPNLRPLIAVGIIEGKILRSRMKFAPGAIEKAHSGDPFERELRNIAESGMGESDTSASGRVAFFLKGKVKGDRLLTMAFDSEKQDDQRLFRDIQPDEFYPVYGDSSTKGFDAQSTGQLYVKIEKDQNYALYGDFTTREDQPLGLSLGAYSRSMNGFKGRIERNKGTLTVFASKGTMRQFIEEIPANGTSGPYELENENIEPNSEVITILVRDRNQPDLVISETRQTRFFDYGLEPYTGRIIFKKPLPTLDPSLNPVSIRVTYEVESGGESFFISGATGEWRFDDKVRIGGSYVDDADPANKKALGSINIVIEPKKGTQIILEHAYSQSELEGRGTAQRIAIKHQSKRLNVRAHYTITDEDFLNGSSMLSEGREEARIEAEYKLSARAHLIGDSIMTKNAVTGGKRLGHSITYERKLEHGTTVAVGVRQTDETSIGASDATTNVGGIDFTSVRVRVTQSLGKKSGTSLYAEYEQDLSDSSAKTVAVGGDHQITEKTKAYFRHELTSSLAGQFALNSTQSQHSTVFGIESTYAEAARVFSEYRGRDAFNGRETEAAIGLRNAFRLGRGRRLNTSFERIKALDGTDQRESLSATVGFELTFSKRWKGTGSYEFRNSANGDNDLATLGFAYKIDEDWTFLSRYLLNDQAVGNDDKMRGLMRLQLGFAYRPVHTDKWNALFMFEERTETDESDGILGSDASSHILRTQFNYNPARRFHLSGGYARQIVKERYDAFSSASTLQLFSTRMTYDIGKRWDIGVLGRLLRGGNDTKADDKAFGFEVGRKLTRDLWISAGYNFNDFDGGDLSDDGFEEKGIYFRLRFKFDEGLFQGMTQEDSTLTAEEKLKIAIERKNKTNKVVRHFAMKANKMNNSDNLINGEKGLEQ